MGMTITLDDVLTERLRNLAESKHSDVETIVRDNLVDLIAKENEDAWNRKANEAYEEYKRTGLHVTYEEMDAWLAKLEAGEDVEPPECHT